MKLKTRIEELERQLGAGKPQKLSIAAFRRLASGRASQEELDYWAPLLREMVDRATRGALEDRDKN